MAIQSVGNFGGVTAQPAAAQGSTPRVSVPAHAVDSAEATAQAMPLPGQPSHEELQKAVDAYSKTVSQSASSSNLQFSIDQETGRTLVRVTDRQTGEMIRQIPSEEMVELAKALDRMQGMLLKQKA